MNLGIPSQPGMATSINIDIDAPHDSSVLSNFYLTEASFTRWSAVSPFAKNILQTTKIFVDNTKSFVVASFS
jgi:hypothetical protein